MLKQIRAYQRFWQQSGDRNRCLRKILKKQSKKQPVVKAAMWQPPQWRPWQYDGNCNGNNRHNHVQQLRVQKWQSNGGGEDGDGNGDSDSNGNSKHQDHLRHDHITMATERVSKETGPWHCGNSY